MCICRPGYEGRACERISCPSKGRVVSTLASGSGVTISTGGLGSANPSISTNTDLTDVPQCSGHGICKTMREAAGEFNGLSLVRAPISYDNWDADKIQGCVCDHGWEGYDCSLRSCPKGRDPSLDSSAYDKEAIFLLECQANDGYFSILAMGRYTDPIPFDADPGYLKYALEAIDAVGEVTVRMENDDITEFPTICGSTELHRTQIRFNDFVGQRPPIFLTRNTSNTRQWPSGSTALTLDGATPIIRMNTKHTIYCPPCLNCYGQVYFTYLNSVSQGVNITAPNTAAAVKDAISAMEDLIDAKWSNMEVNVSLTGTKDRICNGASETLTTISIYSDYGNIPFLGLLDASYFESDSVESANLTWATNNGNGTLYECSNHGVCDHDTGVCKCTMNVMDGDIQYRAVSSDGHNQPGNRGDCGYVEVKLGYCMHNGIDMCNGHGYCSNSTHTCQCHDGWYGVACNIKQCPKGRAFFDEAITPNTAHQLIECSGNGVCEHTAGTCRCRDGFTGPACEIKDCARDVNGEICSGHGFCMPIARFYQQHGFSYGNASTGYIAGGSYTWDAFNWRECVCSAQISAGFLGDIYHPSVGPSSLVSGVTTTSQPLPGWGNWDCSLRNCPKGDTVNRRTGFGGKKEVQRVQCYEYSWANTSDYFILGQPAPSRLTVTSLLGLYGEHSKRIYVDATAAEIADAIGYNKHIGNVTVWFPNEDVDGVSTACSGRINMTYGGFLVRFDTEFGDIPLLEDVLSANITITEYQKGTSANLECGGTSMGFCDRTTGKCICNKHQVSSNGTSDAAGAAGDCSYFNGIPVSDDPAVVFGLMKDEF